MITEMNGLDLHSNEATLNFLTTLSLRLTGHVTDEKDIDYASILTVLDGLLKKMLASEDEILHQKKGKTEALSESPATPESENASLNVVKVLSRNFVYVLGQLPSKVYDLANSLLGELSVNENGSLTMRGQIACAVLTDILENFPLQAASLINFAATQTYKILKKDPMTDSSLVYLLSVVIKAASKSDIDEKFQVKLVKLVLKTLTQHCGNIVMGTQATDTDDSNETLSIVAASYYIQVLKDLLILQTSSNYQSLLEASASSSSGSKLKPEAIMTQQHLYQQSIVSSHEKLFVLCLQSQFTEVRNAMVDLLANLFISFVATGKFNACDYLLNLYPMPDLNLWDETLMNRIGSDNELPSERKRELNALTSHDSETIITTNRTTLLLQIGIVETFIFYIQLELLQDKDFLAGSLIKIMDLILLKFVDAQDPFHIQNDPWIRTLSQWSKVLDFLITESGSQSHDTLARYVMQHFSSSQEESTRSSSSDTRSSSREKKRESILFKFKSLKKNKKKTLESGQINLYTNPYQLKLVLNIISFLLPYGVDFNSLIQAQDDDEIAEESDEIDSASVDEDENKSTTKKNSYMSDLLLALLANDSEYIRNYSLECLLRYASINRSESNHLSLSIFSLVSREFNNQHSSEPSSSPTDRNITKLAITRLMSYSLALLAVIKQADITLLQNSTVAKLLSFCTQNLKHTSSTGIKSTRNGACWIILSSLVTFYHESEFVKLNSSQFFVFWKNLLTSQFVSNGFSGESTVGDLNDVVQNLKLRAFSLLCLLNYLSTVEITPELMKLLQSLLVKSHKYLVFLESTYEDLGLVTGFNLQAFNDSEFNPNLINNVPFSSYLENKQVCAENQFIGLVLYNKKLVMQGFIKVASSLKGDVNSSLVVLLIRIFSDAKLFSRNTSGEQTKEKGKNVKGKANTSRVAAFESDMFFLEDEFNYNFGVTSKFESHTAQVDRLCYMKEPRQESGEAMFEMPSNFTNSCSEGSSTSDTLNWCDVLELMSNLASSHSVNYDASVFILHRYSMRHADSVNLTTSLVDLSIELFQLIFPGLSYKIQFSLLEQLRSSLTSKNVDPMRKKALSVNVSVCLHGLLNHYVQMNLSLNADLVKLVLEILDLIDEENIPLVTICADLAGLAAHLLPKAKSEELIATTIAKIVSDISPYTRGRCVLSLAKIYHFCHQSFLEIHDVVTQLMRDEHPVMSLYSLHAAEIIFQSPLGNQKMIEDVITLSYSSLVSRHRDTTFSSGPYANLRYKYGVTNMVVKLITVCITSLGPGIRECPHELKEKVFQMLNLAANGIGCLSMRELQSAITTVLEACQELVIFDPALTEGFIEWFNEFALTMVQANVKTGVGIVGPTSVNTNSIFPLTTSHKVYLSALLSLVEMTKIGVQTFDNKSINLAWILMELRPCSMIKTLISYWFDPDLGSHWFHRLTQLFNMSSRKLVGKFLEVNYQQKLLPLQQRHKKTNKNANIEFADEEAQNIVDEEGEVDDKNQPINWAFRLLIFDLLIKVLAEAKLDSKTVANLEPKIQEIVRISFLGTTSPIVYIKLKGVDLLKVALEVFGQLEDPLYPGVSILEQQQAQIISALIPCFGSDSDASVIVEAIDVSSQFINLPRIHFYSKQRILKTMIYLLEELSSNKYLKFVHLESMAEYGRKAIQLAILNCWAELSINFNNAEGAMESEFDEILTKYSKLLTSLWILALKELSSLKYNQPNSRELKLYDEYWINFVGVLSIILEKDPSSVADFLQDEEDNFFFVIFCQCSEALIKNQNVSEVLDSVNKLIKSPKLAESLFGDDVFAEVVDLLDRLILMEVDVNIKYKVVETISVFFHSLIKVVGHPDSSSEKFLELLRVAMLPLFESFPFLRQDFDPDSISNKAILEKGKNSINLEMVNKQLAVLDQMIESFSQDSKVDLLSCMLYLISKVFEFGDDELVGAVLPFMKTIISQARDIEKSLIVSFMDVLSQNGLYSPRLSKKNYMITMMILITAGDIALDEKDASAFAELLITGITEKDSALASIQSIKSIISKANGQKQTPTIITKHLVRLIFDSLLEEGASNSLKIQIQFEVLFLVTQSALIDSEEKCTSLFGLLLPLILSYDARGILEKKYWHDKLTILMNSRSSSFKQVVREQLGEGQRTATENLVKYLDESENGYVNEEIELKSFA